MAISFIGDIVANGYFFRLFIMIHSEIKDFSHGFIKKRYKVRTPHALKMCFLSIFLYITMLLSGMITNFMTIMHA